MYKTKGEDPGGTARYYAKGGLGWYTYVWCGGCSHTAQPCNVVEARADGWARRPVWGWLCAECLIRLRFVPGPVPACLLFTFHLRPKIKGLAGKSEIDQQHCKGPKA